jgi:hypothetical protein
MSKTFGAVTDRLLKLRPGGSCFVSLRRLCFKTLRKHAPERQWTVERREGGLLVTRIQ